MTLGTNNPLMGFRTDFFLVLWFIGTIVLVAGCTTQPGGPVSTPQPITPATTLTVTEPGTPEPTHAPTAPATGETPRMTVTPSASQTEDRETRVTLKAENFAFDRSTITVSAGSIVIVEFENRDRAPHNVAFYTTPSAGTIIYRGAIVTGPAETTYQFTAPTTPGTYFFRCDVHPSMQGQFIVT